MKIAMIGHKRIPTRSGGVEVVVEELSTRMVEKGNDVKYSVGFSNSTEEKIYQVRSLIRSASDKVH